MIFPQRSAVSLSGAVSIIQKLRLQRAMQIFKPKNDLFNVALLSLKNTNRPKARQVSALMMKPISYVFTALIPAFDLFHRVRDLGAGE